MHLFLSVSESFSPCFFFFQAEDGIRDRNVTGVQTCALPILADGGGEDAPLVPGAPHGGGVLRPGHHPGLLPCQFDAGFRSQAQQIGRASCRERAESAAGAVERRREGEDKDEVWRSCRGSTEG